VNEIDPEGTNPTDINQFQGIAGLQGWATKEWAAAGAWWAGVNSKAATSSYHGLSSGYQFDTSKQPTAGMANTDSPSGAAFKEGGAAVHQYMPGLIAGIAGGAILSCMSVISEGGETAVVGQTASGGSNLPEIVFDYNKTPELADNIWQAQKAGRSSTLTYGGSDIINANREAATGGIDSPSGLSADEYPFASTQQGGRGAWVGHVPVRQQNIQGGMLGQFYRRFNLKPGAQFIVSVINHP